MLGEKYARALAAKALDSNGQNALRALVSTRDGARGFYVTALTVPSDDVDEMFRYLPHATRCSPIAAHSMLLRLQHNPRFPPRPSTALDPVLIDAIAASPDPNADLLSMARAPPLLARRALPFSPR